MDFAQLGREAAVKAADHTIAIMNTHPALVGYGIMFCGPGDTCYPDLRTLFTRRLAVPKGTAMSAATSARVPWMDLVDWPVGAPDPNDVYDDCTLSGPVHHVTVNPGGKDEAIWHAQAQFFFPEDAVRFQECSVNGSLKGWPM
jgi:hypothetical protein